jgi:hypothetical protein
MELLHRAHASTTTAQQVATEAASTIREARTLAAVRARDVNGVRTPSWSPIRRALLLPGRRVAGSVCTTAVRAGRGPERAGVKDVVLVDMASR